MTDTPTPVADLVAALSELQDPPKTGKVEAGQRRYTFMTLPDLLTAVRATLGKHRIAVMQHVVKTETGVAVTTTLLHATGHTWTTDPLELPSQRDPQSVGSATTYARRYQLAALVGLTGSDDDDAETAQPNTKPAPPTTVTVRKPPTPPPAATPRPTPQERPINGAELRVMHTLLTQLEKQTGERLDPDTRRDMIRRLLKLDVLDSAKDLTSAQASTVIDHLQAALETGADHTDPPQPE